MGKGKITAWIAIIIVVSMTLPVFAAIRSDNTVSAQGPTEIVMVNFVAGNGLAALKDAGLNIVSGDDMGAYVRVTGPQRETLSQRMDVVDLPDRTIITMMEQGISFDTKVGYEAPAEYRKANTMHHIVQFVTPGNDNWYDAIDGMTDGLQRHVGNNAAVVRMDPGQISKVNDLDFVQWVGPYEPAFKLDSTIPRDGTIKIVVDGYPDTDTDLLMRELHEFGAWDLVDSGVGTVACYIDASALPSVAALESTMMIWNLPEMTTMNNVGGRIVHAHDLWVNTVSNLPINIMGAGQIVHVQDTGVDLTHWDFSQGPVANRIVTGSDSGDPNGHGTHVAGTVLGNGHCMELYLGLPTNNRVYNELAASNPRERPDFMGFAGRAPEARLYSKQGLTHTDWPGGYTVGARIFTNSWGPVQVNPAYVNTADVFMASNPGALVLFAAGNSGPGASTVSGAGNGKLAIAVGASENQRPIDFDSSDDFNQMISFSSRGPAAGFRVKPDVVDIGTAVYSTRSGQDTYPPLYDEAPGGVIDMMGRGSNVGDYVSLQGTSMAAPATAGSSALIRQYLVDVRGIANPHANIIKTLLIHGADDMGYGYPSFDQGWGRVNVRNSIAPPAPHVLQWHHHNGISSGTWDASTVFNLEVIDEMVPLKVTMAHWDTTTSGALTTNYDLVVTSPDGTRYVGNAFREGWSVEINSAADWANCAFPSWVGGGHYTFDTNINGGDNINNVEIVRIREPRAGMWSVEVVWRSGGAQPFTVAVTGGFHAQYDVNAADYGGYKVSMTQDTPRIVPQDDRYGEAIFKAAPRGCIMVPFWINNGGTMPDTYTLSAPILPTGFGVGYFPSNPISVAASSREHGYVRITVPVGTAPGTYTVGIRAISNNDGTAPVAQSEMKFQVDVVTEHTPPTWKITDSPIHEDAPYIISWTEGDRDYVAMAYRADMQFGDQVFFTYSNDAGKEGTWTEPIAISQPSWSPGYVGLVRASTGPNAGRIVIAYNAWDPAGYGGDTSDTRSSAVKTHWADFPYDDWTEEDALSGGAGVSVGNSYRTLNIGWYPNGNQFYLVIENFGYTSYTGGSQNVIATIGKGSDVDENGNLIWESGFTRIDPGDPTKFYFFPNMATDNLGNIALYYYERDSSDAAQDRDAVFQYYTGTWTMMYMAWDTDDNLMFPQMTIANQGPNSNRAYGAFLRGPDTDGDRSLALVYTDNPSGDPPIFHEIEHTYGPVLSDHDYGTRFVMDMEYTSDDNVWVIAHRNIKYDPFGQPNMLAIYSNNFAVGADMEYLTLDSFVHGKQRATTVGDKLLVVQNRFVKEGRQDITAMYVYDGWKDAVDIWGPKIEYVSTDKVVVDPGETLTVVANIHDWETGGSDIAGARYKTSWNPGTWVNMAAFDGNFNSPAEAVTSAVGGIDTTGLAGGWHNIIVQGRDALDNWGDEAVTRILVTGRRAPNEPTEPSPAPGAQNQDKTLELSVFCEDYEGDTMTVRFYNAANDQLIGTANGVASGTRASVTWSGLASDFVYSWYAIAEDGDGATRAPPSGGWNFRTLDDIPPAPPTGLTVDHDGPDGFETVETRYMRGDDHTVNDLTAYQLGTGRSDIRVDSASLGGFQSLYAGIRMWSRTPGGVETEITPGHAVAVARYQGTIAGNQRQHAIWTLPSDASLDRDDSIVVRLYAHGSADPPTTLVATFTMEGLGADLIKSSEWTLTYTISRGTTAEGSRLHWGSPEWETRMEGFRHFRSYHPKDSNRLNWTKSADDGAGYDDVRVYRIYRSDVSVGPWDETTFVGEVPRGTETYVDLDMGQADEIVWWYVVRAMDYAGNVADSSVMHEPGEVVSPDPYDIDLSGHTVGDWVFVSFPIAISGNIHDILDDPGTTWDVAKWYDGIAKTWVTYRPGYADTFAIDNTMGVWLHLTSITGSKLTTGMSGFFPASPVNIPLHAGWNMVGYPSATDRTASLTLPAEANIVSVWQAATPYISDQDPTAVTMSHGKAYWVHVTADCLWTVDP